jgi:hypothetical protein
MTTLLTLQKRASWWWLVCGNYNCMHAAPIALAPFIIRFGLDAPRERLERGATGADTKAAGWNIQRGGRGAAIDADLMPS